LLQSIIYCSIGERSIKTTYFDFLINKNHNVYKNGQTAHGGKERLDQKIMPEESFVKKVDKQSLLLPLLPLLRERTEFSLLFGSVNSERISPDSDIDIGVYLKIKNPEFKDFLDFNTCLSQVSNRDIDIIILNNCDIIIAMQVLANGKMIIENDHGLYVRYKAQKIGEYIDFKMDRKIIEDNILRGGIYA
jgi:predicted nucleotidyltransferase